MCIVHCPIWGSWFSINNPSPVSHPLQLYIHIHAHAHATHTHTRTHTCIPLPHLLLYPNLHLHFASQTATFPGWRLYTFPLTWLEAVPPPTPTYSLLLVSIEATAGSILKADEMRTRIKLPFKALQREIFLWLLHITPRHVDGILKPFITIY